MRLRILLSISIALNLALGVWTTLSLHRSSQEARHKPISTANQKAVSGTPPQKVQPAPASRATGIAFDWRQVESPDYRQYLGNLRAIGCPEKTVREIILADVNDLYAAKALELTGTNEYCYWQSEPLKRSAEQARQLKTLYVEKCELLEALGMESFDFSDLLNEAFRDIQEKRELQLAFLTRSHRQEVKELLFKAAQQEMLYEEAFGLPQREEQEQQLLLQIKKTLSPEEFQEYELRCSDDAQQLRCMLDNLGITEQEYRIIFESWHGLKGLAAGSAEYQAAQQSSEATVKQLLGAERFQAYLSALESQGYKSSKSAEK